MSIFQPGESLFLIVLRTTLVYLALLVGLRLAGKREIGQMTVFDLVVLLLLANAVQNAMVGADVSLTGGVLAAVVLLAANAIVAQLRLRFPGLRHWVEGTPTILILRGKTLPTNLRREGLDDETLITALREHGLSSLEEVEMAVLEIDGTISVIPINENTRRIRRPNKLFRRN
jgi:uncharacterized membrane protein YcaP (DUF421 family)